MRAPSRSSRSLSTSCGKDLVDRPSDAVAEGPRAGEASGEETELDVGERRPQAPRALLVAPERLRPVEVQVTDLVSSPDEPAELEGRLGHELEPVGPQGVVQELLVGVRSQHGGKAGDLWARRGRDGGARWGRARRARLRKLCGGQRSEGRPRPFAFLWSECQILASRWARFARKTLAHRPVGTAISPP